MQRRGSSTADHALPSGRLLAAVSCGRREGSLRAVHIIGHQWREAAVRCSHHQGPRWAVSFQHNNAPRVLARR
jgi:hypothetical protein